MPALHGNISVLTKPSRRLATLHATIPFSFNTAGLALAVNLAASAIRKDSVVEWGSSDHIAHLIATYGYLAIGIVIALESMGIPLPGESVLVLAALYAARHDQSILAVVASAASGAVLGDNVGYWIGREFGYRLLLRYGGRIGLSPGKIKLGQYLFLRHGTKVVFFGRFVAVLRVLAAVLAGVNRMDWRRFLLANAAGAILWASAVGFGAYLFGRAVTHVTGPLGIALVLIGLACIVGALVFVRAHETELEAAAERALPGPLQPVHPARTPADSR